MHQDVADQLVQRTGIMAITYSPQIHADDPGYSLGKDVAWVFDTLGDQAERDRSVIAYLVARAIIDPTRERERLADYVYGNVRAGATVSA